MAHTRPIIGIIDDDTIFTEVLGMLLDMEGYDVIACPQAQAARAFVTSKRPDAVLVDVWLDQHMNGWDLVQQLRQAPDTQSLPIIVCSADTRFLMRYGQALRQQGCAMLRKPFATEDLLAQLAQLTQARSQPPLQRGSHL